MAATLSTKSTQFIHRIEQSDPYALAHWAKLFGITTQQLLAAIQRVGPQVNLIAHHLRIVPDLG